MAFWAAAAPYIASAVGIVGSYLTGQEANKSREKALNAAKDAQQLLMDAGVPPDVSKQLILQEFQAKGAYTPELEQDVDNLVSSMTQIKEDQGVKDMQLNALKTIAQRAQGGLTPEDRVAMMNLQDQMSQQAQQNQASMLQNMQQRGISGSGAEIAGMIAGNQQSLNQGAQGARDLMASQSRQALEALAKQGSMSGDIRRQDFDVASAKAKAADAMNQFNTQNQMAVQQRNVGAKNLAGAADWENKQKIANMNINLANAEKERQMEAKKWAYDADIRRRGGASATGANIQKGFLDQASATQSQGQGLTDALSGIAGIWAKGQGEEKK